MALVAGSMRASVPLLSVTIQMLPAPAAMEPSVLPMAQGMVAVTLPVLRSTRESVWSPQLGTQRLPNPAARPEHGRFPTSIVPAAALVFGFSRTTLSRGLFEIQMSSSTAIQSGAPGTAKIASGCRRSIGILTPGVLTPGLGRGGACEACEAARPNRSVMTIFIILPVHN